MSGITVAVGAIVVNGDRFLLVRRGHPPGQGLWSIPGGRVEFGETLPEALQREIFEECSMEIAVGGAAILLDRVTRAPDGSPRTHYLIIDFWATVLQGDPAAGTDAAAIGWFTLDEIRELTTTNQLAGYIDAALQRRTSGEGPLVVSD